MQSTMWCCLYLIVCRSAYFISKTTESISIKFGTGRLHQIWYWSEFVNINSTLHEAQMKYICVYILKSGSQYK
jgi:hypothetical protein